MIRWVFSSSVQVQVLEHGLIWAFISKRISSKIWYPLWVDFSIISHILMLEEHVFVTPIGSGQWSVHLKRTDKGLNSAKRKWLVEGINIIDSGVGWKTLKLSKVSHIVSILKFGWKHILNRRVRMESQFEWEHVWCRFTFLIVIRKIWEPNLSNVVSDCSKFSWESAWCWLNMVREIMWEEIPVIWLSAWTVKRNNVRWRDSASKEFKW